MKLRISALASVLVCSFCVACGGDDDDSPGSGGALLANCQKVCALTAPLNCPEDSDNCVNECQLGATAYPKCKSVVEAAIACSATRPASDYQCSDIGESELKDTFCTAETDAVITCLAD